MSDRVEYINRRLDELEAAAKVAADDAGPDWFTGPGAFAVWSRPDSPTPVAVGPYDDDLGKCGEHIALWDPAAVLARVTADRKMLDLERERALDAGGWDEHLERSPLVRLLAEGLGWKDGGSE